MKKPELTNPAPLKTIILSCLAALSVASQTECTFADDVWSDLGGLSSNAVVIATAADAAGNLYIGGSFTSVGGVAANNVAKWDGHAWSALGSGIGLDPEFGDAVVYALAASGTNLYAGGLFTTAGGNWAVGVAKWNGSTWSALGPSVNNTVGALLVRGTNVYAGGIFTMAGTTPANRIARWDGTRWSSLGTGVNDAVFALEMLGTNLYAGGWFTTAGDTTVNHVARWDGNTWSRLQNDIEPAPGVNGNVYALAVQGTNLFVGGAFGQAGGYYNTVNIARWNGNDWWEVYPGVNNTVFALGVSGTNLYVGGDFTRSGPIIIGLSVNYIAKWNGNIWSALGSGVSGCVNALTVSGENLYVGGGYYTNVNGYYASTLLARARIDPAPPPVPASFASIKQGGAGTQALITFTAEPGTAYDLLSSSDLVAWEFKSSLYAAGPTNTFQINKTRPREFYQLRQIP